MATSVGKFLVAGEKTIAAAGTAEVLESPSRLVRGLVVIAKAANTNPVFLGGSDVDSSTNGGFDAGKGIVLDGLVDTGEVWVDVTTNDEGVDFFAALG